MNTRIGPVTVDVDTRDLRRVLRGLRISLFRNEPFPSDSLPEGWYFPDHSWPSGFSRPTDYWVHIWREDGKPGEHITIKPDKGGWWVDYDPENSWNGGFLLGPKFGKYDRAVEVAIDAMERVENGEDYQEIRYDYTTETDNEEGK